MTQESTLKIKGLFTSFNDSSEVPEGALEEADNIDILQDSMAQPRRGFDRDSTSGGFTDTTHRPDAITIYQDKIVAHHGATLGSATTLSTLYSGSQHTLETVSAPNSSNKMRFVGANQNLYYTSSTGVRVLDIYTGTPRAAGAYKALDVTAANSASASTWMATAKSVAYRAVWFYIDENDNYIFGAPSQRYEHTNSSGSTKAVDVTLTIPSGVTTSWFIQLYRSKTVDSSVTPSDELGLVYEANPTSGEISAKSMVITDIVPDSLLGATLYTSSSQEGLAASNEVPPFATDISDFRDCVFVANTQSKHRFFLTILGIDAPNGVQVDDTIGINGVTFTAKTAETVASGQFKIYISGSAAQNVEDTALSLVRVINQYASNTTVYAYYLSGVDDTPGKILIEARTAGGASFPVISSRATCWSPANIPTSGTTTSSNNDAGPNKVAWSKPNQPEAFPLTQTAFVGAENDPIIRIKGLRDALYIFKEGGAVYKLTGYWPNFQIDKIEDSVKLVARETVQVLNNQIYCLSEQGVTVLGDGTKVISRPIEQDLRKIIVSNTSLASVAFGVAYESDRKYYLYIPTEAADTYPTQAYVFNIFTNSWVRSTFAACCGMVDSDNNLYLGRATTNYLSKEKRAYTLLDFADYGFASTIATISSNVITLGSGFDNTAVGDVIYQSSSLFAIIESRDVAAQTITVDSNPGFTVAATDILKSIDTRIKWVPIAFKNPSVQKQFHTAVLIMKQDFLGDATLGFSNDLDTSETEVTVSGSGLGLWGLFAWGERPWGGYPLRRPVRQWVPRGRQRSSTLSVSWNHAWGFSNWQLLGISIFGEMGSEASRRE